jgi:predicted phage baseplate assembly protein
MPLPAPNLDDRRFQDLVDDAKRLVQQKCPAWTDHNVSDPGVTLIETFAYLVDQLLYRLNRTPDRNYLKFLELLGVHLFSPEPARVAVTFWLSAPQPDTVIIPAGTEVSTRRTETEDSISFTTTEDLPIVRCSLEHLRSHASESDVYRDHSTTVSGGPGFFCFSQVPIPGDTLLLGLSDPMPSCAVVLRFTCTIEGVGVDPRQPPLAWEAWDGEGWVGCDVQRDDTGGLNRDGDVILHIPPSHTASVIDRNRAGWLRARVTETVTYQPTYSASPRIDRLAAFTAGGTVEATHGDVVEPEIVGLSEFRPGQRFLLEHAPVAGGGGPMSLQVAGGSAWEDWTEVQTFADSSDEDRHFKLDRHSGEIEFGPAVRQADGSLRQYGAMPPKGAPIRLSSYRTGGGRIGNVSKGAIQSLKSAIPYVARVENRRPAAGGVDGETVEEAKVRGPIELRTRNRAVTAADYEHLAQEAERDVARVICIPPGNDPADAGAVRLLVVPACEGDELGRLQFEQLVPDDELLASISQYLDARRVIGTRLLVEPPTFQGITIVVSLRVRPQAVPSWVQAKAKEALYRYFHPIMGGPDGNGWPFGRSINVGEVYAVLQQVEGVAMVEDARLFGADPLSGHRGDAVARIDIGPTCLVYSYEHLVRVVE